MENKFWQSGNRIELTEEQRKAIHKITRQDNWFHSYTETDFAVCANHEDQQWKKVFKDGRTEKF